MAKLENKQQRANQRMRLIHAPVKLDALKEVPGGREVFGTMNNMTQNGHRRSMQYLALLELANEQTLAAGHRLHFLRQY
jgi:hypothetical protein